MRYHRTGRAIYAVGGNREAARAAGIKVNRVRMGVYVAGSILAAIGGLMEAGRVSSVAPTQGYGEGIIFAVFAAAVIGGVSLQGGRGNMVGAATGVILLGVVQNILDLENAPNYWIDAINGAVILFALILARVIGGEASAEWRYVRGERSPTPAISPGGTSPTPGREAFPDPLGPPDPPWGQAPQAPYSLGSADDKSLDSSCTTCGFPRRGAWRGRTR